MSEATFESGEYVVDRHGTVWLIVRDGGMAARANEEGSESIGIISLALGRGPLHRLEVRPYQPPTPPWNEGVLPPVEQLAGYLRDLSRAHFEAWLDQSRESSERGHRCFVENHDDQLARTDLSRTPTSALLDELRNRMLS